MIIKKKYPRHLFISAQSAVLWVKAIHAISGSLCFHSPQKKSPNEAFAPPGEISVNRQRGQSPAPACPAPMRAGLRVPN
jgi:hypothetical protein